MEREQIERAVSIAIDRFLKEDVHLLETGANEPAMTCMLSRHLSEQLPEWAVDCEYNRDQDGVKRLRLKDGDEEPYRVARAVRVIPDIIVHRRGTGDNLLVVEAKKSSSTGDEDFDRRKLREFLKQFHYTYAMFLRFIVGDTPDVEWQWVEA